MALFRCGAGSGLSIPDNTYYEWAGTGSPATWKQLTYTDGTSFHNTTATNWAGVFNVKGKTTMTFSVISGSRMAGIDSNGTLTVITQAASIDVTAYDLILVAQTESSPVTNNMTIS